MFWLLRAARKLRERGILGMNRRNASYILDHNPRAGSIPLSTTRCACATSACASACRRRISTAKSNATRNYAAYRIFLGQGDDFVVKPSNGSAGRGVLVVMGRTDEGFIRHSGEILPPDKLRQHLSAILSGMYRSAAVPTAAAGGPGGLESLLSISRELRYGPPSSSKPHFLRDIFFLRVVHTLSSFSSGV